jgi:hypothetical protein
MKEGLSSACIHRLGAVALRCRVRGPGRDLVKTSSAQFDAQLVGRGESMPVKYLGVMPRIAVLMIEAFLADRLCRYEQAGECFSEELFD